MRGDVKMRWAFAAVGMVALCGGTAWADEVTPQPAAEPPASEGWKPSIAGSLFVMVQRDKASSNDIPYKSYTDTYGDAVLKVGVALTPEFSIRTNIQYAPVLTAMSSRYFKGEGAYVEELNAKYESGPFVAFLGKFDPSFALVGRLAPGLYGTDFAGDYTLYGQLGGGASYEYKNDTLGSHTLGAGLIQTDNSFLSASAINGGKYGALSASRYERTQRFYGGVGNTAVPRSFYVTYDGNGPALLPGLHYQLAFSSLANGSQGTQHQNTYVAGAQYTYQINDSWALVPLAEWARVDHVGGAIRSSTTAVPELQNARYLTYGGELRYNNWSLSAVRSIRDQTEPQDGSGLIGTNDTDHEVTASLSYYFDFGLGLGAGWKHAYTYDYNTGYKGDADKYGLQAYYYLEF